ncbi:MAG: glycosyltransferase family 4 protein [Lachnospiraceae bacterium]|nr:glycosyltransferase family 4 protein [Lachnospiraceae bacterium]
MKENPKERKRIKNSITKVAQIGHKRIPSREGGVEIVVEEISVRLVKRGYLVDAYNRSGYHVSGKEFDTKRNKIYKGIRILTIPTFQNGKLNAIVYSVLATIRALFGNYDIYHFHAEGPCIMLWLPKLFGKKVVATIHGLDWQRSKWGNFASKVLKKGEREAVKHADYIIVLSQNIKQYFLEEYGRETWFIPNGVNMPQLVPVKEIQAKWGLEKDEYILFLARIVPEKGVHYLLQAFLQIQTDKKLVIAGGSSHTSEYVKEVMEMAQGDDRIIFTHFVQGRQLEELFSNAYLFVLPSDVEGMAISLLEAMSYGNCCLISDIPENVEAAGEHARTFLHGQVEDLKKQLEYLLENPECVAAYRAESQKFICEKYNWDDVVEQTIKLYE